MVEAELCQFDDLPITPLQHKIIVRLNQVSHNVEVQVLLYIY